MYVDQAMMKNSIHSTLRMAYVIIIHVLVAFSCIDLEVFSSRSDTKPMDRRFSLVPLTASHHEDINDEILEDTDNEAKLPRIGIDLGQTHSSVAVHYNDDVTILTDEQGSSRVPSCVAFTENGEVLVGHLAEKYQALHPENTVCEARRLVGKMWDEEAVEKYRESFPVKLEKKDGQPYFVVHAEGHKKIFSPVEISGMIISKLKKMAEDFLGQTVSEAVIAVPFSFNDQQRGATKEAAALAKLNITRLAIEPFCVAYSYGIEQVESGGEENVLVYDLGMSSLDASVVVIDNGVFEVLASAGNFDIGNGNNLIQFLITHLLSDFLPSLAKAPRQDATTMFHLRREVESAIATLSSSHEVSIQIKSSEGLTLSQTLTQTVFEKLAREWLRSSLDELTKRVLKESWLTKTNISAILIRSSGYSSHLVPHLRQVLQEVFDDAKTVHTASASEEVLARGTATYAHLLDSEDEILLCGGIGQSVGIETMSGAMHVLLAVNCWLPHQASAVFTTASDNQSTAIIKIYKGERPMAKDNMLVGQFTLKDLRPAPRGIPRIKVTLSVDVNDRISVTATDLQTGNTAQFQKMESSNAPNMDQKDDSIVKMDRLQQLRLRSLNYLQRYVYSLNKELKADDGTLRDSLRPEHKLVVSQAIDASLRWLDANQNAERNDFQMHHEQLKAIIHSIISDAESFKDKQIQPEIDDKLKDEL